MSASEDEARLLGRAGRWSDRWNSNVHCGDIIGSILKSVSISGDEARLLGRGGRCSDGSSPYTG